MPFKNSSITTTSPALPNLLPSVISFRVKQASSNDDVIITPFPAAKPSAFKTYGGSKVFINSAAASNSVN